MRSISRQHATITAGSSFAYGLAARMLRSARDLDLSSLRVALCGAEPIAADTLNKLVAEGAPHGLRPNVATPCYGLAEATLAVSIARPGRPLRVDRIDRAARADRRVAEPAGEGPTVDVVALGRPLRGTSVRIVGEDGQGLDDRRVGEIHVAGPSLMTGYLGREGSGIHEGWLATGDLGYLADGEVHVCGRIKDLIIVGGHNIHPNEVERAAETVGGVRMGGTVAFAVDEDGHESIVVVCEARAFGNGAGSLVAEVRRRVADVVGVAPRHVLVVRPGAIPKTSSGKLRRREARARFLTGQLGGSHPEETSS
jgi:fatty-acyl-CoA synthase